jgi:hypothetical protein
MSVESFASFLAAAGHRVIETKSAFWYDATRGFFLSLPSHLQLRPEQGELREVLRHQPCFGVRFPAPVDGPGKLSYQIVCDVQDYGLEQLSANVRSKVRRGLRRCEVKPVPLAELAVSGRVADTDTLSRQGRTWRFGGAQWDRYWKAADRPGMEGWGAFVGGELAAFLLTADLGDCVEFLLARSRSDLLDAYPNNALVFQVAEEMLVKRRVVRVTFGLESLEPVGPLDQFKFGMGFRREPIRQRVVFHPVLQTLLRSSAFRGLLHRFGERRGEKAVFWRKASGLVRFAEAEG